MRVPRIAITMGLRPEESMYRIGHAYVSALERAGAVAISMPHTALATEATSDLVEIADGLLLAGGTDIDPIHYGEEPRVQHKPIDPDRDAFEITLCREAMEKDLPILAICRGIQVLNVAAGGTLYQDVAEQPDRPLLHEQSAPRWHPTHQVALTPGTTLAGILDRESCRVNSFHHQTIREIGRGFVCNARASDGTIEGIEDPQARFVLGVQWHPENLAQRSRLWLTLFERFVAACLSSPASAQPHADRRGADPPPQIANRYPAPLTVRTRRGLDGSFSSFFLSK